MKNIKNIGLLMLSMSIFLTSCLKDKGFEDGKYGAIRDTEGGKSVNIRTSGFANVQKSSILINTQSDLYDTIPVFVDLNYFENTTAPVTVKLAIDNAKVATYNSANGTNYLTTTSDMAKLKATELTIPAGERFVKTELYIKQSLFSPAKSYMIPVTITDVSTGFQLTSNLNTRYFNIIGNPLAGSYSWTYRRYQQADTSGAPNGGGSFVNETVTIPPVNETTLLFPEEYTQTFINPTGGFLLSFKNTNGLFSNFDVTLDEKSLKDYPGAGFTIGKGATLISATIVGDETNQYKGSTFSFYIQYINSSGGVRTLINTFTKL